MYYLDRSFRTYIEQGRAIIETVENNETLPDYGVVMLPDTPVFPRQHDLLAALVLRELKDRELYVATIHSAMGKECYESKYSEEGQPKIRKQERVGVKTGKEVEQRSLLESLIISKFLFATPV